MLLTNPDLQARRVWDKNIHKYRQQLQKVLNANYLREFVYLYDDGRIKYLAIELKNQKPERVAKLKRQVNRTGVFLLCGHESMKARTETLYYHVYDKVLLDSQL